MLSVLLQKREGYAFCYALQEGGAVFYGGMTPAGELVCDEACTQKELMLRTLVFKCMNDFVPRVYTCGAFRPSASASGGRARRTRRSLPTCACRTIAGNKKRRPAALRPKRRLPHNGKG